MLGVDLVERAGHAEAQRTGLAGGATAADAGDDVVRALQFEQAEGVVDLLLVQLVGEVLLEAATVDAPLPGTGDHAHAGDGLLAAAHGLAGNGQGGAVGQGGTGDGLGGLGGVAGQLHVLGDLLFSVLSHDSPYVLFVGPNYWATWVNS